MSPTSSLTTSGELATAFHSFYNAHTILSGDEDLKSARLTLAEATRRWSRTGSGCSESARRRPCRANGDGEKGPDRSRPPRAKGGFLRGLVLGLAVAVGVQLYHAGLPDWFGDSGGDGADAAGRHEPSKTNFDFYRFLPKTEVRIDDPEAPGGAPQPAERTAGPPLDHDECTTARQNRRRRPPGSASTGSRWARFRKRQEADRLRASLALGGFESSIRTRDTASGTWHRVTLGPFRGREAAEAARARLLTAGQGIDARIVPNGS